MKDRWINAGQYMKMKTTKFEYALSYGMDAWEVGNFIYSLVSSDYEKRASKRGYKLF